MLRLLRDFEPREGYKWYLHFTSDIIFTMENENIDTKKMKELLEKEQLELEETLARHGSKDADKSNWQGKAAEDFKTEPADMNETADKMEELAINMPLVEELETRYENILAALKKIGNGTYGICEKGGEKIPTVRLEANPAARTCIEHAK